MKGADSPHKNSKQEADALMEYLRNNPPQVKSINEVVNLLHVISAEQRSNNVLRSCVDKVLMNMSNIRTLRDIIERLRSVSRTNGFRFELPASSSPETRCRLVSDMFSVKIILGTSNTPEHSPTVLDVSIQHRPTEREEYKTCPHLVNVIRNGNFLELSSHLKGLTEMYLTSGSKHHRIRVFMALQSLETDLVKMSQIYRETHKDASSLDVAMEGTVGMLTPRVAGDRSYFTYYISPYDLIDTSTRGRITLDETVPKHIGLHAEVGIEQRSASCNLPITPLITNKHPVDNTGVARFLDISQHNSMTVPAAFVLYLKPAVPVLSKVAEAIKQITNLDVSSDDNSLKPYLELLNTEKKTFKIPVGDEKHIYHLNLSNLRGTLVNKIYFTHPGHVTEILDQLRKQSHINTLISSCIRDNHIESKKGREWYFEVSCTQVVDRVNVTMEHPSANGTAFLEIRLDKSGFQGCKIYTGRGDPPLCADEFVAKILRKCSSLPITMRKLIEQTIKNPKKQTEVKRARPLFAPPTHHHLPPQAILLTPVQKPPVPQPRPLSTSSAPSLASTNTISALNFFPMENEQEPQKKVTKNPMLTKLLIPTADPNEPVGQSKVGSFPLESNHPMLMTLLKDDSDQEQSPVPRSNLSRGGKTQNTQMGYSHNQLQMGGNQQNQYNTMQTGNPMGFMSPNTVYPSLEPPIPIPVSHTMPPPSYPSQYGGAGQLPSMSPAQHSPANVQQFQAPQSQYSSQRSPMGGIDDMGPITPTNFGMMSPGLVSPGANMQPMGRGRRASRQKSHSVENPDFASFDLSQDGFQQPMGMDAEIMALQNRSVRRTDSMSPGGNLPSHLPLQHSTSLKSISENIGNGNLLQRSVSSGSGKGSTRSMTSPRNLRTPENTMTLASPPMFDNNFNQRGSRGKSFDSHNSSDFFRSSFASESPGGMGGNAFGLNSAAISDKDLDVFAFDERNPSKISVTDNSGCGALPRNTKPPLYHSTSTDKDETLRDLAKNKPALLKALTGDVPAVNRESTGQFSRQPSISTAGLMPNLTSIVATNPASSSDLTKRLMTSTSVTTVSERSLVRQNAVDKQLTSNMQSKTGEIKGEKPVRRRNSSKNEEGKAPAKKRGRPPTVKDHAGKRKKADNSTSSVQDDSGSSNPPIMLNIQFSATGAPISSSTKTKPLAGVPAPQSKNQQPPDPVVPAIVSSNTTGTAAGSTASGSEFDMEKYLKSQHELQKRKKEINKDKKVTGKSPAISKQSLNTQPSNAGNATPSDKMVSGAQTAKPLGSVSPRSGGGGVVPQKRPRKNTGRIQDVIDKLTTSKAPPTADSGKQSVEKDANSNLLTKSKSLLGSTPYQKTPASVTNKMPLKTSIEDKSKTGASVKPAIHSKGIFSKAQQDAAVKPPGLPPGVGLVLKRINETAAASATKRVITTPLNKVPPAKLPRAMPPAKARSVTPTSTPMNPAQRKSPQLLKGLSSDAAIRQGPTKQPTTLNPSIKKSPVRPPLSGGPIRPSSAPSVDTTANPPKAVSTSPTSAMVSMPRKTHSTTPTPSDQHFIAPSISPTPTKRTSSPQVSRTTSPLTRVDDKANKGVTGRSPHRPSPTHSRISTPIPSSNPQSPDDRLMIVDDPTVMTSVNTSGSTMMPSLSRDEQRPVFIPGARLHERQSPERTVMSSPLSPPQQKNSNMLQTAKRASTPKYPSPRMSPISSASPYPIDDDLMNQAVTG